MLVNLALIYVLPMPKIAGANLALGTAAGEIFGKFGDPVVRSLTIVSMISGINAFHLMASRVLFAMSRDGLFTRQAARVNAGGTPTVALFLSAAVAVLFIVAGGLEQTRGLFETIIAMLAFFFVVNYLMSFISVFVLRRREPDRPRPYRTWGYPWTTGLVLIGSIAFLIAAFESDRRTSIYSLLLLGASYPVFRLIKMAPRRSP
jgi:APA family basic amino acid/polyamine antiporter